MPRPRRYILLTVSTAFLFLFSYIAWGPGSAWRRAENSEERLHSLTIPEVSRIEPAKSPASVATPTSALLRPTFTAGAVESSGSAYSQTLVVARLKSEDITWIQQKLPGLQTAIYTVDDAGAPLQPPVNKGHEAMVYLTYIIDNYNNLSDTTIFIHSHQLTWHNNDLFDSDTGRMVSRLRNERVAREGYFNLRCHLHPGCPDWISLNATSEDINKKEEVVFAKVWDELHPGDDMPDTLAQPCCAQFAASRDRIQSIPLARWNHYRDWLLNTDLESSLSGRIWEYTWQYVFTGKSSFCPAMHECYCKGYGVCFGSAEDLNAWLALRREQQGLLMEYGKEMEAGRDTTELLGRINAMEGQLQRDRDEALRRGEDPLNREAAIG